ncbi:MAG: depupylase/deamidase Dop [Flaviflexus sp.]|nr:depupylase/deamidase Dop [Flaviflexus sp.]
MRIIGTETEFGITSEVQPNPIMSSALFVQAYAADGSAARGAIRWDYRGEDPLRDARGFSMDRAAAHPSQLTDEPLDVEEVARPSDAELNLPRPANTVLTNGARLYVDHAHPEYSSPEAAGVVEAALYDRAGEYIAREAISVAASNDALGVYKNNVDGKGASYGSHENYLVRRDADLDDLVGLLIPFFVTRQILCGAGRVGIGPEGQRPGFQISQRADYIENDIGLETTFNRPIVNTRDEPHASSTWRRLHVIIGDANQFDVSNLLKLGTTSLVLWLAENLGSPLEADGLRLADPVDAVSQVSHDPSLTTRLDLKAGGSMTPIEIQRGYYQMCREAKEAAGELTEEDELIFSWWDKILTLLATDIDSAAPYVEWVGKKVLLEQMAARGGLDYSSTKLKALDLQWHDVRVGKNLVERLARAGRVHRLFSDAEIARAATEAPKHTRAYLRGNMIAHHAERVVGAGWTSLVLDLGREDLLRVTMMDPGAMTADELGDISNFNHLTDILQGVTDA